MSEKVASGIEGFDTLLFGGFPKGRSYLISGEPGTGKTIFCLQYLLAGAKLGERGIYICIDDKPEHVIQDAESLGWDIKPLLASEVIQILDVSDYFGNGNLAGQEEGLRVNRIIEEILSFVKKTGATRLAIDPISPMVFSSAKIPQVAEYIRRLVFAVESASCTTLLTSYVTVGSADLSQHGVEEFAASGIILLKISKINNKYIRTIWVRKMRGTRIDLSEFSFEILPRRGLVLRQPI